MAADGVKLGIQRCPFLASLAQRNGEDYAHHIATRPAEAYSRSCPVLEEDTADFAATFQLFHGPAGIVPLRAAYTPVGLGCPLHRTADADRQLQQVFVTAAAPAPVSQQHAVQKIRPVRHPLAGAPLASMSISFGFGSTFGDWWSARQQAKAERQRKPRFRRGRFRGRHKGKQQSVSQQTSSQQSTGNSACPLRRMKGPLAGLVAKAAERELKCPAAIVQARAAVARLKPVRQLRPQALPVKLLAIGAFTGMANVPSGIARAHVEKFSPEWFVAVHATIPFIAMLRKAVLMPKWAVAWTIGSAVIGQVMGARFEKLRLEQRVQERVDGGKSAAEATATAWQRPVFIPSLRH